MVGTCEDDADSTSCLSLNLMYSYEELAVEFSLLQSGVWGVARSTVPELPQRIFDTISSSLVACGQEVLHDNHLRLHSRVGFVTASFFTVQLPADISTSFRLSRPQQSGLYLIDAKGFQQVWRGDDVSQWSLVDYYLCA
jgi:hypothetical protein